MAWLAYFISIILIVSNVPGPGLIVFAIGMLIHWKYWIAGMLAFFIGFNLTR